MLLNWNVPTWSLFLYSHETVHLSVKHTWWPNVHTGSRQSTYILSGGGDFLLPGGHSLAGHQAFLDEPPSAGLQCTSERPHLTPLGPRHRLLSYPVSEVFLIKWRLKFHVLCITYIYIRQEILAFVTSFLRLSVCRLSAFESENFSFCVNSVVTPARRSLLTKKTKHRWYKDNFKSTSQRCFLQ